MALWPGERDKEAAVVSQGTLGIVARGVYVGIGTVVAHSEAVPKAGRMEAEKTWDSAPPMIVLCSAVPPPPAV